MMMAPTSVFLDLFCSDHPMPFCDAAARQNVVIGRSQNCAKNQKIHVQCAECRPLHAEGLVAHILIEASKPIEVVE